MKRCEKWNMCVGNKYHVYKEVIEENEAEK
jgi:hypothetical protein